MRRLLAAAVLALGLSADAQELDIFDVNDFVDPRDLGAKLTPEGKLKCPCQRLFVSRLVTGAVSDYVDLLKPTNADVSFAHLATSYYDGKWQLNAKVTTLNEIFEGEDPDYLPRDVPQRKYALQAGRYFTIGGRNGEIPSVLRAQVNYSMGQYRDVFRVREGPFGERTVIEEYRTLSNRELGIEVDTRLRLFRRTFVASVVYVDQRPQGNAPTEYESLRRQRLTLLYRAPRMSRGDFHLDAAIAFGAYRIENAWVRGTVLPSIELTSPSISRFDIRVHARYQPSVQRVLLNGPTCCIYQQKVSNQVSLFIDAPIFAKSF